MMMGGSGRTQHYSKVMGFIDGSNLLIEISKEFDIDFRTDKPPLPALKTVKILIDPLFKGPEKILIRKYRHIK